MKSKLFALSILTILALPACGNKENPDYQLLRDAIQRDFSLINMESLTHTLGYVYYNRDKVEGLSKNYTISFDVKSVGNGLEVIERKTWGGSKIKDIKPKLNALGMSPKNFSATLSYDTLGTEPKGTIATTFVFKCYTEYIMEIYLGMLPSSKWYEIRSDHIFDDYVKDGHYHHEFSKYFHLEEKYVEHHGCFYEYTQGMGTYNHQEYNARYYFDDNPRIEGLSGGTYYVGNEFTSGGIFDAETYTFAQKVNNIFKLYGDSRYITEIS